MATDKPFQVDFSSNVIQTQLDQLSTLLDKVSVLGNHVLVTPSANADTDHCGRRLCYDKLIRWSPPDHIRPFCLTNHGGSNPLETPIEFFAGEY